jgi:hypothetical protein
MNSEQTAAHGRPASTTSQRKIEANRRNAQLSTGPKTPEGKARSSQNATSHGIFIKCFLNGAAPETVAEIAALTAGVREHYRPVGVLEEMLVRKIVVEAARYDRVLGFEHQQLTGERAFLISRAIDCIDRYTTSTSRALFRAMEQLERVQAARKACERPAVTSAESPDTSAQREVEQEAPQVTGVESRASSTPEDDGGDDVVPTKSKVGYEWRDR